MSQHRFVRFFDELAITDVPLVGGKNAALGEAYRQLRPLGVVVPNGFALTAEAYRHTLERAGAWPALHAAIDDLDVSDVEDLARRAKQARDFDGFSIGSNDLTQLVLGVDRDSATVAFDFDERDPGVLEMLRQAVEGARRNGRHSGICGQAPSDFPEVAEYLVRLGIDSISLNPDTVIQTTMRILEVEAAVTASVPPGIRTRG
jgi:phosphoenolpyruvate synthase/pyruvate phosphate dikinase